MRNIIVMRFSNDYIGSMDEDLTNYIELLKHIRAYAERHHEDSHRKVYDTYALYKTALLECRAEIITSNNSSTDFEDQFLSVDKGRVMKLMDIVMLQLVKENKVILSRGFNGVINSYMWI